MMNIKNIEKTAVLLFIHTGLMNTGLISYYNHNGIYHGEMPRQC